MVCLPAYASNRTERLLKSPKPFWSDVGPALCLSGSHDPSGAHPENLVLRDLLVWRDARTSRAERDGADLGACDRTPSAMV